MTARKGRESQFFDVWFEDTVGKPFDVIQKMYDFINMDYTAEARAAMVAYRQENQRGDRPSHEYTLEEYGYSEKGDSCAVSRLSPTLYLLISAKQPLNA